MDSLKMDALSVVITKLEGDVKEKMFDINNLLSSTGHCDNLTEKLKYKIMELSNAESALGIAKNFLSQAVAVKMAELRVMTEKSTGEAPKNENDNVD